MTSQITCSAQTIHLQDGILIVKDALASWLRELVSCDGIASHGHVWTQQDKVDIRIPRWRHSARVSGLAKRYNAFLPSFPISIYGVTLHLQWSCFFPRPTGPAWPALPHLLLDLMQHILVTRLCLVITSVFHPCITSRAAGVGESVELTISSALRALLWSYHYWVSVQRSSLHSLDHPIDRCPPSFPKPLCKAPACYLSFKACRLSYWFI